MTDADEAPATTSDISDVPLVYGNGFLLGLSNADVSLFVQLDNIPQVRVAISYTTAKTLRNKLNDLIDRLEKATTHTIMTSDEIAAGLQKEPLVDQ